jgi:hypothetical protein
MTIVEYLRSLIASVKIKEAIQNLSSLFTASDPDLETTTIMLFAEYNLLNAQKVEGVISDDKFAAKTASLNKRVLELIKQVEKDHDLYSQYFDQATNTILKKGIDKDKKTILFLCANPDDADIDLTKEIRDISEKLSLINKRAEFEFKVKKDLRKKDFQRAILELDSNPKFLHFAGSGNYKEKDKIDGLKLYGNDFKSEAVLESHLMTRILEKFDSLECVFLNACNTTPLALELSKKIPYIISMSHYVSDRLAITFATSFYEALASGKGIEFSFHYGLDNLELEGGFKELELNTPRLLKQQNNETYEWHGMSYEAWKKEVKS